MGRLQSEIRSQICDLFENPAQKHFHLKGGVGSIGSFPSPNSGPKPRLPWDLYTHQPRLDVFFSMTHYAPRFSPVPTVVAIMDLGFLQTPEQFTPADFNQLKAGQPILSKMLPK